MAANVQVCNVLVALRKNGGYQVHFPRGKGHLKKFSKQFYQLATMGVGPLNRYRCNVEQISLTLYTVCFHAGLGEEHEDTENPTAPAAQQ